jgi:IclR family KDG regulon transcriptional repressor
MPKAHTDPPKAEPVPSAAIIVPVSAAADEKREKGGIQSVERAFAILEQIAHSPSGATLSELSKRVGLHSSTVFHLVQTLVALGYVRQMRDTKRYRVGRPLFALAAASNDDAELVSIATPALQALSADTGEAGHFGVWSGQNVLVLAKTPGAGAFQMTSSVGLLRPAYATGLGKALLSTMDEPQLERYLREAPLAALTPRTITDPELLRRSLQEARRIGLAYDDGEFDAEIRCVAAVVRDFTGRPVGVIGISGPVWRLSLQALHAAAGHVRRAAADLSAELGHQAAAE